MKNIMAELQKEIYEIKIIGPDYEKESEFFKAN